MDKLKIIHYYQNGDSQDKSILYRKLSYIEREINLSYNNISIIHKLFLYIKLQKVNKNIEILHIVNYD